MLGSNNLKLVTFTGADDSVKAVDILKVEQKYPKTEWGILFGGGVLGGTRFPSRAWVESEVPVLAEAGVNLSAHLCGRFVNDLVLRGDFTWFYSYSEKVTEAFDRIQINFHGMEYEAAKAFYYRIMGEPYQFIFQKDLVNQDIFNTYVTISGGKNAVELFDVSHGAGVLPKGNRWPGRKDQDQNYLGYAGGLGPHNITEQLPLIDKVAGEGPYWIDMETKVRSNKDYQFDLGKVEAVCKAIWE